MGIPFFIVFALSIAFLSMGVTGWYGFVSVAWNELAFTADSGLRDDLDGKTIPQELRQAFVGHGLQLSDQSTVWVEKRSQKWLIRDENHPRRYPIRLSGHGLNIYNGAVRDFRLEFEANYSAIIRCGLGFLLFLISLYLMGFFLYLEERESGRIMKNVKSFVKLREFLERLEAK